MYLFNLLLLIFSIQFQNKFIENQNISIEFDFELTEETKKKNTYKIKFTLKNKKNKPLYYVSDYIKSETKININNFSTVNENSNSINDVGSSAPPPLSSSAYVDSGGAAKVDSESSSSVGGKKMQTINKKEGDKKAESTSVEYYLANDIFELHLEEAKSSKFTTISPNNSDVSFYFKNKEKVKVPIKFNNVTDKNIEIGFLEYNPVICIIPTEGLEINSTLVTNSKKGINPNNFYLKFSKNIVYTNSIKLELDKSFHTTIESAIEKYNELQSVLKNN